MLSRFRNLRILPIRTQRCLHTESADDPSAEDREFVDMKVKDFSELFEHDNTIKDKVETILNEYEYAKYNSMGRVPTKIEIRDMKLLLEEGHTSSAREKLIHFLFKREMNKRASKLKLQRERLETRMKREVKLEQFKERGAARTGLLDDQGEILYGLWHNSLFCRIPDTRFKGGASASRLISAAMFGRKLVFDFGFDEYMCKHALRNSIEQVQEAYGLNRFCYRDPMDLWFCNFRKDSYTGEYCVKKAIKNLYSGSMITVKEDCFMNHFDTSRLVYLSPNAKEPLGKVYKNDDVYIIGVFNDKGNHQPVSYRKAVKLGIRTKCLPIDSHLVWQGSTKSLCINHVAGILLEYFSNGGDWAAAFARHVPKRKIKPMEVVMQEEEARLARLKSRKSSLIFGRQNIFD